MIKRLKRIYELSKKDPEAILALTDEQVASLPDEGDGKAEFFGEGTEDEFKKQEQEDKGFKGIFGL